MLKNLATCYPKEFFVQTNRIRKLVKSWLIDTGVIDLQKTVKELADGVVKEIDTTTADEKEMKAKATQAAMKRLDKILDTLLETDVDKTVELLCYCCFVPPQKANEHRMEEYLECITDMINNEAVLSFFMSLVGLTRMTISD